MEGPQKTALYVRLPTSLATELDREARVSGRSKQGLVTALLTEGIKEKPGEVVATESASTGDDPIILDLEEVAELLRVQPADVLHRLGQGDLPARRIGESWRFSRSAVLDWMGGVESTGERRTGF